MKYFKYCLFVFFVSIFIGIGSVSAESTNESKYYELIEFELTKEDWGVDIIQFDNGYYYFSNKYLELVEYDKQGKEVNKVSLDFKPNGFFKMDNQYYVIGKKSISDECIVIAKINNKENLAYEIMIEFDTDTPFYFDCDKVFEIDDYVFILIKYENLFLKIKKDLTSYEFVPFDDSASENVDLLSDIVDASDLGNVLMLYDNGVVYYSYDNEKISYYKNGQIKWVSDFSKDLDIHSNMVEYKGNLVVLVKNRLESTAEYNYKYMLVTISGTGEILEIYDIDPYIYEHFPFYTMFYSDIKMIDDNLLIFCSNDSAGESSVSNGFYAYFKYKEPKASLEKVPETMDNITSYLLMLFSSAILLMLLKRRSLTQQ